MDKTDDLSNYASELIQKHVEDFLCEVDVKVEELGLPEILTPLIVYKNLMYHTRDIKESVLEINPSWDVYFERIEKDFNNEAEEV